MKIIEDNKKDSKIIIMINTVDDLWYLKNILSPDDQIITSVFRRVEQNSDLTRSKATERKKIKIRLKIEKIDFLPYTDNLKILGEITEGENSGSHQSVMIGIDDEITVIKDLNEEERNLLKEAVENYYRNTIVFVSMDDETCTIALLKSYGIQGIGEISSEKSGKDYEVSNIKSGYYDEIISALKNIKNPGAIIILGPGFEHTKFYDKIVNNPAFSNIKIYDFPETDNGKRGIYEFMAEKKSDEILKGARLASDEKLIENFLMNLNKTQLSVYGFDELIKYAKMNMLETLLISESKFKDPETRKLLNEMSGVDVHIISDYTDSGGIIKQFGGYCGILRYKY
ncbi:mRNA surveillance protein pelota [Ferroplasma sp.]|uniref:mRNA surveillance protein pelota n=1 Tax=Ferroplasma sp. TaxID=2591003 RepID=UPI00307E1D15